MTDWVGVIGVAVAVEHLIMVPVLAGTRYLKALHRRLDRIEKSMVDLTWAFVSLLRILGTPIEGPTGSVERSAAFRNLMVEYRERVQADTKSEVIPPGK